MKTSKEHQDTPEQEAATMLIKPKVSEQAIRDLLQNIPGYIYSTSRRLQKNIKILLEIEPLISSDGFNLERDRESLEDKIKEFVQQGPYAIPEDEFEFFIKRIFSCVVELENYSDKRAIIKATAAYVTDLRNREKQLNRMSYTIEQVFRNLDQRTREILSLYDTLTHIDGIANTRFCNELPDAIETEPEIIRNEPALAPLIEAYEFAKTIIENED